MPHLYKLVSVKPALIAAAIGIALTGLGYGVTQVHDVYADERYVKQDTYAQAVEQQRIWKLQDAISAIQEKALDEERGLTTREEERIEKKQNKIDKLRE